MYGHHIEGSMGMGKIYSRGNNGNGHDLYGISMGMVIKCMVILIKLFRYIFLYML